MRVRKDCAKDLVAVGVPARHVQTILGQECEPTGFETNRIIEVLFDGSLFGVPHVKLPFFVPHNALESVL
jgi:hypothetical protein